MDRNEILDAFRHQPLTTGDAERHEEIAQTMSEAVVSIAGKLPDCYERSAFIDLCRQARVLAEAAVARKQDRSRCEPARGDYRVVRLGLPGPFHRATVDRPSFETRFAPPPGTYSRAVFRFRVFHAGWNPVPAKNHNLFWCARDKHRDLFGFGVARGPGGPPQVFFRSDWGVRHTAKQRVVERCVLQPGTTYDVRFDFDADAGRMVLALRDPSGEVMRAAGVPNISEIPFAPGQKIATGFGFRGEHENEPAQPGWIWSDLGIELEPAGD